MARNRHTLQKRAVRCLPGRPSHVAAIFSWAEGPKSEGLRRFYHPCFPHERLLDLVQFFLVNSVLSGCWDLSDIGLGVCPVDIALILS